MPEEKVSQKLAIDRPCSACSSGDTKMEYHDHHPPFRAAADAGPRPRTRHEFNQGTGFCEICGGHVSHVRSEYCLPPPKRPAAPPVPQAAPRCPTCKSEERDMPYLGDGKHFGIAHGETGTQVCPDTWHNPATAPDSAMRVARKIWEKVTGDTNCDCEVCITPDSIDDETIAECAALIRQAVSEREREVVELCAKWLEHEAELINHHSAATLQIAAKGLRASRLLGGESKP